MNIVLIFINLHWFLKSLDVRTVSGLCKPSWLKMTRASRMFLQTQFLLKACTHDCRKYRYRTGVSETHRSVNITSIYPSYATGLLLQFLRQETESLWSEYAIQYSQLSGNSALEHERTELQEQWRGQQAVLQRRGSSLGTALRQIDSTENHMVDFTDRLDRYLRQPKDITAFTLANTNILRDIKVCCQIIFYYTVNIERIL